MFRNLILLFLYVSRSDGNKPRSSKSVYNCSITKHSYMVAIGNLLGNGSFLYMGGGTLLSDRWALTAAVHMYNSEDISDYTVVAGVANISEFNSKPEFMQTSLVEVCYRSTELITDALDIALLKLKKSIYRSEMVSYVQLATEKDTLGRKLENICAEATVVGYGNKWSEESMPSKLTCAKVPVISPKRCNDELPYFTLPDQLICIFNPQVFVCHDDAGGPVMCNGIQYGIVSAGYGCGNNIPSIVTRVDKYETFIKFKILEDTFVRESKCSSKDFLNFYPLILSFIFYWITDYNFC